MTVASASSDSSRSRFRRLAGGRRALPLLALGVAFVVSRIGIYWAGVRFDASPLPEFYQYIDPLLLKHRLLESLFYLHSQPPLYNLGLGVLLKLFPGHFSAAAHAVYLVLGLVLGLASYSLLVRLGLPDWGAAALAVLVAVSPATLLYENWLFYEYPVAALLVLSAVVFDCFLRRRCFWTGFGFFL